MADRQVTTRTADEQSHWQQLSSIQQTAENNSNNNNKNSVNNTASDKNERVQIKRSLGVWNGIAIIIGVIVGSGIFISPKGVLLNAGSVGASLLVWALCGLLALMGALCFAELGTSISSSGGEYTYINLAYGPLASYLYIWVLVLIIMPCSNAISALTFANYCLQPLFQNGFTPPEEAIRLLALAILMLLIYINCVTLDGTIKLQSSFSMAKVLALGMIIFYGLYYILAGNKFASLYSDSSPSLNSQPSMTISDDNINNSNNSNNNNQTQHDGWWAGTQTSLPHLARAFYSGFFTYSGWSSLNAVTEEIKRPHKSMPRAIVLSIGFITLIYILANAAYFAVLTREEILGSDAIAVLFGEKAFGGLVKWLMPLVVALSTVGGLNSSIFTASRIYFAAAREGQLFNALAMINSRELTPIPSLLFLGFTSILYLTTTKISALIDYMTFIEASFAALGVSTMIALRLQQPNLARPLRIPLIIPGVYLLFTGALIVLPLWTSPWQAAIGIMITLTGLPAYYLTAKWEEKPASYQRWVDKLNGCIQKLTMSEMPTRDDLSA